jgi:hypothetical protein
MKPFLVEKASKYLKNSMKTVLKQEFVYAINSLCVQLRIFTKQVLEIIISQFLLRQVTRQLHKSSLSQSCK